MNRQSSGRNQDHRSRGGFKLKNVMQVCLLLALCFWLIYEMKHSRDQKKEFDPSLGTKDILIKDVEEINGEDENKHEQDEIVDLRNTDSIDGGAQIMKESSTRDENYKADDASSAVTHDIERDTSKSEGKNELETENKKSLENDKREELEVEEIVLEEAVSPNKTGRQGWSIDVTSNVTETVESDDYFVINSTDSDAKELPTLSSNSASVNQEDEEEEENEQEQEAIDVSDTFEKNVTQTVGANTAEDAAE